MKRFGVNVTRTITVDQTVYVTAHNEAEAMKVVQDCYDNGRAGDAHVTFKGAKVFFKEPYESETIESIEVNEAYEEDE